MDNFSDQIGTGNCALVACFYGGSGPTESEQMREPSTLCIQCGERKVCWSVRIFFLCDRHNKQGFFFFFFNLSLNNRMNENGVMARSVYGDPCWGFVSITNIKSKRSSFVEHSWPGTHPWGVGVLISHCRTRPTWFSVDRRIIHPWPSLLPRFFIPPWLMVTFLFLVLSIQLFEAKKECTRTGRFIRRSITHLFTSYIDCVYRCLPLLYFLFIDSSILIMSWLL